MSHRSILSRPIIPHPSKMRRPSLPAVLAIGWVGAPVIAAAPNSPSNTATIFVADVATTTVSMPEIAI